MKAGGQKGYKNVQGVALVVFLENVLSLIYDPIHALFIGYSVLIKFNMNR